MKTLPVAAHPRIHSASGARLKSLAAGWAYIFILILFLTSGCAMSEREHGKNDPPSWDGNPTSWRHYQDEVRIWTLGQDLDVKYCLAARLIRNLTGPARRAALTIAEADLLAIDSNKKIGIQNVMAS